MIASILTLDRWMMVGWLYIVDVDWNLRQSRRWSISTIAQEALTGPSRPAGPYARTRTHHPRTSLESSSPPPPTNTCPRIVYAAQIGDPCGTVCNENDLACEPNVPWFGVTCKGSLINVLNLAENNLTGTIPNSIGNLTTLEFLYLNLNDLSNQQLPDTLYRLEKLSILNLGLNSFRGTISTEIGNLYGLTFLGTLIAPP